MPYPPSASTRKFTIRYKGLFDFDGLYNLMVQWMKARRFWFHEVKYKHKVPSPYGAEQEIFFMGEKKVTDYFQYRLTVDIHIWDMTEVEVVHNGVKKTLTNARMQIILIGYLDIDWEKRWDTSKKWKTLKDFYNKYILKEEIESIYWDTIQYKTQHFMNVIKEFLDMEAKGYEYKGYIGDTV